MAYKHLLMVSWANAAKNANGILQAM